VTHLYSLVDQVRRSFHLVVWGIIRRRGGRQSRDIFHPGALLKSDRAWASFTSRSKAEVEEGRRMRKEKRKIEREGKKLKEWDGQKVKGM
jgi:hypothetical protein